MQIITIQKSTCIYFLTSVDQLLQVIKMWLILRSHISTESTAKKQQGNYTRFSSTNWQHWWHQLWIAIHQPCTQNFIFSKFSLKLHISTIINQSIFRWRTAFYTTYFDYGVRKCEIVCTKWIESYSRYHQHYQSTRNTWTIYKKLFTINW